MTLTSSPRRPIFRHHAYLTFTLLLLLFHLLPGPTWAQSHSPTSSDPSTTDTPTISRSTAVVILILITSFFFMGFVSLYIRHCSDDDSSAGRRDPGGSVFRSRRAARGLHPDLIDTFPIFTYAAVKDLKFGKYALECAVCLTEFDDDDSLRLLPHCDHVFHPDCVDTWLQAHTTCPVCRADLHAPHAPPAELSVHLEVAAAEEEIENQDQNQNPNQNPSMEQPLRRDPTVVRRNASFGRVWGRIARSFSTGHVAVKQWENLERFRLRLPEEVRKEVMNGKLQRAASMVDQPTSRTGYAGEGSSRGRSRSIRTDRWVLSFFSKTLSFKSPKPAPGNPNRQSSLRASTLPI